PPPSPASLPAPLPTFLAPLCVGAMRNVEPYQIHCSSPEQRAASTPHQHGNSPIGKMAWITIGVPTGKGGHTHFSGGYESATIADSVSARHRANECDARFPSHRRTKNGLEFR